MTIVMESRVKCLFFFVVVLLFIFSFWFKLVVFSAGAPGDSRPARARS
jgi:hypothetical protein